MGKYIEAGQEQAPISFVKLRTPTTKDAGSFSKIDTTEQELKTKKRKQADSSGEYFGDDGHNSNGAYDGVVY